MHIFMKLDSCFQDIVEGVNSIHSSERRNEPRVRKIFIYRLKLPRSARGLFNSSVGNSERTASGTVMLSRKQRTGLVLLLYCQLTH